MKTKKIFAVTTVSLAVLIGGCIAFVIRNEQDRQHPVERYREEQQEQQEQGASAGDAQTDVHTGFTVGNISYEFLSYEQIADADIATQTKYPAENFYDGVLPDPDYQAEMFDYAGAIAEAPELEDVLTNRTDYTQKQISAVWKKYSGIDQKYLYEGHPDTDYYFIHMKITNSSADKERDVYLSELITVLSSTSMKQFAVCETVCYFSASQYTNGDDRMHNFFLYHMQPEEELDCVLGFAVRRDRIYPQDQIVYIGTLTTEAANGEVNPAPCETLVSLEDIRKEQE